MAEIQEESKSEAITTKKQGKKEECPLFYSNDMSKTLHLLENYQQEDVKQIEYVFLVGFHHIVGSQIEFVYPPVENNTDFNLTSPILLKIA